MTVVRRAMRSRRSWVISVTVVIAVAGALWWHNWQLARPLRLDRQFADCDERARLTSDYLAGLHVCLRDRYGWSDTDPEEVARYTQGELNYMLAH